MIHSDGFLREGKAGKQQNLKKNPKTAHDTDPMQITNRINGETDESNSLAVSLAPFFADVYSPELKYAPFY